MLLTCNFFHFVSRDDTQEQCDYIVRKLLSLRLFDDATTGKRWHKSVKDLDLELLCVSQFTLYHVLKGRDRGACRACRACRGCRG